MAFTTDPDGTHRYAATCTWSGSTGVGYDGYERAHAISSPPAAATLELSNDPAMGGDASRLDPEQLVLAAASSCQLLSFLAIAARARIDVTEYRDDAEATMSHDDGPARIAAIVLRPHITVAAGPSVPRVERLVHLAHKECYVANSLATPVAVEPVVTFM
ncbi:OsmC family protein [Actinomycetospora flava]|uniref:OsmC family protein n=1 Tax=Actinomycetospora flava TaxID=3129232 RepID=A0ABU8ME10_9PSEU